MLHFEFVLLLLVGTCTTTDITSITNKRIKVLKDLSVIVLNTLHFCHSMANYSKPTLDDAVLFWELQHPLVHTEFGCAGMCVGIMLQLIELDSGNIHVPHAEKFLKYKNADDDMIKTLYDLGLYCRDTISMLNVTVEPCWIALEYIRCIRDGIEDLGWVPKSYDVNKAYSDFLVKVNQEVGKVLPADKMVETLDGSKVKWAPLDTSIMRRLSNLQPETKNPKKKKNLDGD